MKRFPSLLLLLSLFAGVAANAHPKILRIVGTVEHLSEATLTVKTNQGRLFTVVLNNETMFMRGDMPSPSRNLKVGDRVILRVYKRRKHLIAGEIVIETSVDFKSEFVLHYSPTLTAAAARALGPVHQEHRMGVAGSAFTSPNPNIFDDPTVANRSFLVNDDLETGKPFENFVLAQGFETDRCGSLIAVENDAALANHYAAGLQRGQDLGADASIEVVENHNQIELVRREWEVRRIKGEETQTQTEPSCGLFELTNGNFRDVYDGHLPLPFGQKKRMPSNPSGEIQCSTAIGKSTLHELIQSRQEKRIRTL